MGFGGYTVIAILVVVVIFFICRELFCWYWKINEIRDLLQSINDKSHNSFNDSEILNRISNLSAMLSTIDTHLQNIQTAPALPSSKVSEEKASVPSATPADAATNSVPKDFIITSRNGRKFAMKDGRYYCPKCYSVAGSEFATMCSHCGASFTE